MGTITGVGVSNHRDPTRAAKEAVKEAMEALSIKKPDFVFMFASVGYNQEKLVKVFGNSLN